MQAPHFASVCPVCGPVSVDPSETDLSKGGDSGVDRLHDRPVPRSTDGRILLAATLRPETVFGVTNLWLPIRRARSPPGTSATSGSSSARPRRAGSWSSTAGTSAHEVPVVGAHRPPGPSPDHGRRFAHPASPFVVPDVGTGVVMSVPAHAPADWLAIRELTEHDRHRLGPPSEVIVSDRSTLSPSELLLQTGDGLPAERAARATGARSLADSGALQEATERLYRLELVHGRMRPDLLGGLPVARAREEVARQLAALGRSPEVREFSEPVVCRNGHDVVIQRVPDQWFIRYSDPVWKAKTKALVERMRIAPEEYGRELPDILDWLGDRPCTRRGTMAGDAVPQGRELGHRTDRGLDVLPRLLPRPKVRGVRGGPGRRAHGRVLRLRLPRAWAR